MPSAWARGSTRSRSGRRRPGTGTASTPCPRSCLKASRTSSARLTAVMRPIHPTAKRPRGCPTAGAREAPVPPCPRASSSMPSRMTLNLSGGATPSATRSSRTSGLTATRRRRRASRRSIVLNSPASRVEVAAQHVPVEGVDDDRRPRVAGGKRRRRPIAPALAVCVCRICGRSGGSGPRAVKPAAGRGPARSRGAAAGCGTTSRRAPRRRTTWSPHRGRAARRRASSRSRAARGPAVR